MRRARGRSSSRPRINSSPSTPASSPSIEHHRADASEIDSETLLPAEGPMQQTLTINRRPRRLSGAADFLAATRQVVVNPCCSRFGDPGHASCEELGMAPQTANRRESDRVPMGVESAMPWVPAPSSKSVQPPKAKSGILGKLVIALLVL